MDVQKNLRTIYATLNRVKMIVRCMSDGTNATEKCRDCEPCKCRTTMMRVLKSEKQARELKVARLEQLNGAQNG